MGRRRFQTEREELRGQLQVGTQRWSKANVEVVTIKAFSTEASALSTCVLFMLHFLIFCHSDDEDDDDENILKNKTNLTYF